MSGASSRWPRGRVNFTGSRVLATSVGSALLLAVTVYVLGGLTDQTLGPALLTFFGVLVTVGAKHLVDRKSEQHLRLDAAMKAGSLLSPAAKDVPVSPAAAASGLLALAELGRSRLAVAMLVDLWPKGIVSEETAILVINRALSGGQEDASLVAAEVLCKNASRLDPVKSAHWPSILDQQWVPHAPMQTKILLIEALVEMSTAKAKSLNALRSFSLRLYGIWERERDQPVKGCVANLICALVPALQRSPLKTFLYDGRELHVSDFEEAAATAKRNPDDYFARVTDCRKEQLQEWASHCLQRGIETNAGALAAARCTFISNSDAIPAASPA